ncbi:hypothetical protein C476_12261 [Natrinema limicola JCM 13563]|uniref:Uncharacterized protein n=1 Tax=Natrinema limicola JCM 13563 TaxID=1230457 RepID=M0CA51_9EURY|nr:hypothetical protein C476_12261 [Natrinema limicola JCM 13563]
MSASDRVPTAFVHHDPTVLIELSVIELDIRGCPLRARGSVGGVASGRYSGSGERGLSRPGENSSGHGFALTFKL